MIRSPIGMRVVSIPGRWLRDQIRQAAELGARGVVLDAAGELSPDRLGPTGRRDLRHFLRSMSLALVGLVLPTRRAFDTEDDLEARLARAERAFEMAYEVGSSLVLARLGGVPPEEEIKRRSVYEIALTSLGMAADKRGVRLAVEAGPDRGSVLRGFLEGRGLVSLAASVDPGALIAMGQDPVAVCRELGKWVAHAYASEPSREAASTPRVVLGGKKETAVDWAEYLGVLEEIEYRGFVTIWPGGAEDQTRGFQEIKANLDAF